MIKTTRRHLDTCECIIEYSWDDESDPENIQITKKKTVNKCTSHSHLEKGDAHLDQIFIEDRERLAVLQNT